MRQPGNRFIGPFTFHLATGTRSLGLYLATLTLCITGWVCLAPLPAWGATPSAFLDEAVSKAEEVARQRRAIYKAQGRNDIQVIVEGDEVWEIRGNKRLRVYAPPELLPGDTMPGFDVAGWLNTHREDATTGAPDVKGKVVLVDFSATWCGPCIRSLPHVQSLRDTYAKDGLEVIVVTNETKEKFQGWASKKGITMPVAYGATKTCKESFGARSWPSGYLFDHHQKFIGEVSPQGVRLETQLKMALYKRVDALNKMAGPDARQLPIKHLDPDVRLRRLQKYYDKFSSRRVKVVHGEESGAEFELQTTKDGKTSQSGYISDRRIPSDPMPSLKALKWWGTRSADTPPAAKGKVKLYLLTAGDGPYYEELKPLEKQFAAQPFQLIVLTGKASPEFRQSCTAPIGITHQSGDNSVPELLGIYGYPCLVLTGADDKIAHIAYLAPKSFNMDTSQLVTITDAPEISKRVQELLRKKK